MSNYIRPKVSGATIFFTVNLAERGSDLLLREIDILRWSVAEVMARKPFKIDAWVVLPDHLHAIWILPANDHDYSTRWKEIKTAFSRRMCRVGPRTASKTSKGEVGLWQRRFWDHHIRSDADYQGHLAYCWGNPVKHGLVKTAQDWPFSSIHRDIRHGRVSPDWSGKAPDGAFGE